MKFSLRVLALALLLSPLSSRATIQAGNDGLESVWGAEYRSFQSNLVTLRYDITLEPLARQLFPRIHAHLEKLQKKMGFKLNRPFPVFLISRAFGNAFVAFPTVASPSFSVISPRLSAVELSSPTFLYAGDEEDFFDTFSHEIMHYIEGDQRLEPWAGIFGDAAYRLPDTTAWMTEAWAVVHEAREHPLKGRMKESFFGALMKSTVSERDSKKPEEFDLSYNNPTWRLIGSHYVMGSNFYTFLKKQYGFKKLNDFVIHENKVGWSSAYTNVYGKSFEELFGEFQDEIKKSIEATQASKEASGHVVFDGNLGSIGAVGSDSSGNLVFTGSSLNRTTRLFRLDAKTKEINQQKFFEWLAPFTERLSYAPLEWSAKSGKDRLYYFASQDNTNGNAVESGLYVYDFTTATRRRVKELPLVRAAVVSTDGDTYYSLRQTDPNENVFALEVSSLAGRSPTKTLATWKDFSSVSQIRVSDDKTSILFSGIKSGGTWGIYAAKTAAAAQPRLVIDSPGQDLFSLETAKGTYFLSDLNKKSFQVYRVSPKGCVQQISHEPYFVRDFHVAADGRLVVISRRGNKEVLVEVAEAASEPCLAAANVKPEVLVPEESAATIDMVSVEEPALEGIIPPSSRIVIPRYNSGYGYGLQAILASESPYKDWGWTALYDVDFDYKKDYNAGVGLDFHAAYPVNINLSIETSRSGAGSFYFDNSRFLNTSLEFSRDVGTHSFSARLLRSSTTENYGLESGISLGIRHSFSNTQSSALAAGPRRGWALHNAAEYFPRFYVPDSTRGSLSATQDFYLPILESFFPTHSVRLGFSEAKGFGRSAFLAGSGGVKTRAFQTGFDLEQPYGNPAYASNAVSLRGYSKTLLVGSLAAKTSLNYAVPLNFMRGGMATVFGRRWLNPESTAITVNFYYDVATIQGMNVSSAGKQSQALSSTGLQTEWSLWMSENHQTGVTASYIFAKELNLDKKIEHTFALETQIAF